MNETHLEEIRDTLFSQTALLSRIAIALETLAMANAPAPAFVKPFSEYKTFDWNSIGASVVAMDQYGVAEVDWGGYTWKRRSPTNNFNEAIYYSRPIGKKQDGSNNYARLITFKDMGKVKPISREAEAAIAQAGTVKAEQPAPQEPDPTLDDVFGPNPRNPAPEPKPEDAPDWCKIHKVKMAEVSDKTHTVYHRLTLEDGKVAFCNGSVVKLANGHGTSEVKK